MNSLQLYRTLFGELEQLCAGVSRTHVRTVALMAVGIILSRSVWLSHVVRKIPGSKATLPSLVNRLHRFLVNEAIVPYALLTPLAAQLLRRMGDGRVRLVMDASKIGLRGAKGCRILTVSLCYRKRTLPLFSHVLPGSKGQVKWKVQEQLLTAVANLISARQSVVLVADAGFEAIELLRWLQMHKWDFVLRRNGKNCVRLAQHHCALGTHGLAEFVRLDQLLIQQGELFDLGAIYLTEKHALADCYLTLYWQQGEESPWYLVASFAATKQALRTYQRRMWVEEMYGDLKRHGFNIAQTHLVHTDRIARLLMVAFIAYLLCIALGSWLVKNGMRKFVDHKSRRDKSYFRIGCDWIDFALQRNRTIAFRLFPYLK